MKYFTILFITLLPIVGFAQNQKPVAITDTLTYEYTYVHSLDSVIIATYTLMANDYDPDSTTLSITDVLYNGPNDVDFFKPSSSVVLIWFKAQSDFSGIDSFSYVVSDFGSPEKKDTAQVTINVIPKRDAQLLANNIKANITPEVLFTNGFHDSARFNVPKNTSLTSIYGANLWISGTNNGVVHSNARKFGTTENGVHNGNHCGNAGPVSFTSHQGYDPNIRWNRVWKVTKEQIDYHLAHYQDPGYIAAEEILSWPTHGIILKGETNFVAPYFDRNQDLLYDPYDGDFPEIKGDEAIFFIYNDGGSSFNDDPMISEVHGLVYAFSCGDSALDNTIFVDYKIINRSTNTYDSTHFGMWADLDLGNIFDDFLQCDVERNLFYIFNGDQNDDTTAWHNGYGQHIPAQGVLLLNGPKKDMDGLDNQIGVNPGESINGFGFGDNIVDNEKWGLNRFFYFNNALGALGDPRTDIEFHRFLNGKWPNGSELYHGGTGYQNQPGTTTIPTNFMFPGDSDPNYFGTGGIPVSTWTETSAGNTPSDRRGLGITGPITFAPNDTVELTYAFVFGRDYVNTGAQAGVDNMLERVDSIQSYYDQGILTPCGFPSSIKEPVNTENTFVVYPNPTKDIIYVKQGASLALHITIYDVTGKLLKTVSSENKQTQINTNDLPKGLYVISIQSDSGKSSQMFIKN